MNEQDFSKIFKAHKKSFSDNDFSEQVIKRLPKRKSMLPQTVMIAFVLLGMIFVFVLQVYVPVMEQLNSLITSVSQLQMPSASAIFTYFVVLGLIGLIGFSVAQAGAD